MSGLTRLLDAAAAGDRQASADLLSLVYNELRKFTAARMAAEAPGEGVPAGAKSVKMSFFECSSRRSA
jgi:hypothetical protein